MKEILIGSGCVGCGIVFALLRDPLVLKMIAGHFDVSNLDLMMRSSTDFCSWSCPDFCCCQSCYMFSFWEDSDSCRYHQHVPQPFQNLQVLPPCFSFSYKMLWTIHSIPPPPQSSLRPCRSRQPDLAHRYPFHLLGLHSHIRLATPRPLEIPSQLPLNVHLLVLL